MNALPYHLFLFVINIHLYSHQDAHSSDREDGEDSQSVTDDVPGYGEDSPLGADVIAEGEGDSGDVEDMEDEEGEDELDLEYEFGDDDDEGADYDLSWRKFITF